MKRPSWWQKCAVSPASGLVGIAALFFGGCQRYEALPLDLDKHKASLDQRDTDSPSIRMVFERLCARETQPPSEFSFTDGLTSQEGEVVALFYNGELRAARVLADAALAQLNNSGLWSDPEFGFDAAEILSPSGPFEFGLTLRLTIPVSGRLEVEQSRADAAYQAEIRKVVEVEWSTRIAVRRAWAAWTHATDRLALLRAAIEEIERIAALTERLEAAGELSRVEARLFQVELSNRRAATAEAESHAEQARIDLLELMGLPPNSSVALLPGLSESPDLPELDHSYQVIIERNAELASRRADYQVAEEALRLEIQKQYPDITIGTGYGSESNDDRLLLGVTVPIPIINANRAEIAEARSKRDAARISVETTFERLIHAYARQHTRLKAARRQRDEFESRIVPLIETQVSEIDRVARLGEVDTLTLLESVKQQLSVGSRLLDLRMQEYAATLSIAAILGPNQVTMPVDIAVESEETLTMTLEGGDR